MSDVVRINQTGVDKFFEIKPESKGKVGRTKLRCL
jgi:hypothetical protein